MVLISRTAFKEFCKKHAGAKDALNNFGWLVEQADWSNFHEMKRDFGSVDAVGNDRNVFNIRGNIYRLIAMIIFPVRTFYIRFIGTHAEYDKLKDASGV